MNVLANELGISALHDEIRAMRDEMRQLLQDNRPEWYTQRQYAEQHNVSLRTVQRRVVSGVLPTTQRHGVRMIHRDDL